MPAGEPLVESLGKTCTRYKMKTGAEMNKLMTNCAAGIQREIKVKGQKLDTVTSFKYSLIPKKCQGGGDKYALPITVKFDQSTRKFGRISFARLYAYCSTSLENIGILTLPPVTIITVVTVDTSKKECASYYDSNALLRAMVQFTVFLIPPPVGFELGKPQILVDCTFEVHNVYRFVLVT